MQRHDKDKKCFAKRRSIMGYCRTNFGDFLMKINIENVQILVYVGRNCISASHSLTTHTPRKSQKSDKNRQKATQQKTINGRNGYKKSQTFRSDPALGRAYQRAPQLSQIGSRHGLRFTPLLKGNQQQKSQTIRYDLLQSASHKAPPIKEGFGMVVDMIGGWPRP